jgi:hypothetical protein
MTVKDCMMLGLAIVGAVMLTGARIIGLVPLELSMAAALTGQPRVKAFRPRRRPCASARACLGLSRHRYAAMKSVDAHRRLLRQGPSPAAPGAGSKN